MTGAVVYLDHNATTPVRDSVIVAMTAALRSCGNPSSVHGPGRRARQAVERARDAVRSALGLSRDTTVVFTSGGTEANMLALTGTAASLVLAGATEHDSVIASVAETARIPVDSAGVIDLEALRAALANGPDGRLVSVMAANNETGVIQPIAEAARIAHDAGALFHCDAVQCLGRIPFDARDADLLTVSGHKLGGPQGVGALIVRPGIGLHPRPGGGQESGLRPGTENVPGIVGLGVAITEAVTELPAWAALAQMRDGIASAFLEIDPAAVVFGAAAQRLPNTLSVAMPGVSSETQIMALDLAGIAVSAGSACSSGKVKASHVLAAMGVAPDLARCAIRISLGPDNTGAEIDRLIAAWRALRLRTKART